VIRFADIPKMGQKNIAPLDQQIVRAFDSSRKGGQPGRILQSGWTGRIDYRARRPLVR
jgi:hypothetical protein